MRICVFGAASSTIDPEYIAQVEQLGKEMASRGHSLVFGAGAHGLMGAAARGVRDGGGYILGVVPKFFDDANVEELCDFCDELIRPDTMRQRKQIMEDNCDAFIVVPGGIGTFEEYFEILTSKQLCQHSKPIGVYNIKGYYNELEQVMTAAIQKNFIKGNCLDLYKITDDQEELLRYIETPVENNYTVKDLKDG